MILPAAGNPRASARGGDQDASWYICTPPGRLAQLGERRLDKAEVTGSSPVSPTGGFAGQRATLTTRPLRPVATPSQH
jgi:hypothetical protein